MIYAVDSNIMRQTVCVDGAEPFTFDGDITSLIRTMPPDSMLVLESGSFENFRIHLRDVALRAAADRGIAVRVVQGRSVNNLRRSLGLKKDRREGLNMDDIDAKLIYAIAQDSRRLKVPTTRQENPLRSLDYLIDQVVMRAGGKYDNEIAESLRQTLLAAYDRCPDEIRDVLFEVKGTRKITVKTRDTFALSMALAARHIAAEGGNRDDFDRLVGLYEHGFPSQTRSNAYYHTLPRVMRALGVSFPQKGARDAISKFPEEKKQALRLIRRASRWIFSEVSRAAPTPATGSLDPVNKTAVEGSSDPEMGRLNPSMAALSPWEEES